MIIDNSLLGQSVTNTQLAIQEIISNATLTKSSQIDQIINKFRLSDEYKYMQIGAEYYRNVTDVDKKEIKYYDKNGTLTTDLDATNFKIKQPYWRLLTNQKTNYMISKAPTLNFVNDTLQELFNEKIEWVKYDAEIKEAIKNACKMGRGWILTYVDILGNFNFQSVDPLEVIPIYNATFTRQLDSVMRTYIFYVNGVERTRVEWWYPDRMEIYIQDGNENYVFENAIQHLFKKNDLGEIENYETWDTVPFIEFANNDLKMPDGFWVKSIIDAIEMLRSRNCDELWDTIQQLLAIKGYLGNDVTVLQENFRRYGMVMLHADGGMDSVKNEIQYSALESTLKALKKDIYTFAQSVDMENMDSFGNASGVALKYYYSGLEMNVNETEMYIKVGMQNFFNLFQLYLQLSGLLPKIEKNAVEVIFNHSMIQNTAEMIENAQKSKGIISDRTIVTNHPWVDDVDAEIQEMEKEIQI